MSWNNFLKGARGIDSVANTTIKVGAAAMAAVAITKFAKKKGQESAKLDDDRLEIKKMEMELKKAQLQKQIDAEGGNYQPQEIPAVLPPAENDTISGQEKLLKYHELLKAGAISQEEYDALKRQVLGL